MSRPLPPIRSKRLELVSLEPGILEALLLGDRKRAETLGGLHLPEGWPPQEDTGFLLLRLQDLRDAPHHQQWLLRAMVLPSKDRQLIGHIGFHGPPDAQGRLEVGYEVLSPWRRQGFAREAVEALFTWATQEHGIARFVASVSPTNAPSLSLVARLGFRQVGTKMDALDGEEHVFELERGTQRR